MRAFSFSNRTTGFEPASERWQRPVLNQAVRCPEKSKTCDSNASPWSQARRSDQTELHPGVRMLNGQGWARTSDLHAGALPTELPGHIRWGSCLICDRAVTITGMQVCAQKPCPSCRDRIRTDITRRMKTLPFQSATLQKKSVKYRKRAIRTPPLGPKPSVLLLHHVLEKLLLVLLILLAQTAKPHRYSRRSRYLPIAVS